MSVSITVNPRALERILQGRLSRARVTARTERVAQLARQEARPHGSMADADVTYATMGSDGRGLPQGTVGVHHPAGRYVMEGTDGPYPIRARRKKALRFQAGGSVLFRKAVMHPGIKADPFLLAALRRGR